MPRVNDFNHSMCSAWLRSPVNKAGWPGSVHHVSYLDLRFKKKVSRDHLDAYVLCVPTYVPTYY